MKDNKYYQQAKQALERYQRAERDYKPDRLKEEQIKILREIKDIEKEYGASLSNLSDLHKQELRQARQKLDEVEKEERFFDIVSSEKIDFEKLELQERLENYFAKRLRLIDNVQHLESAVEEIINTGNEQAITALNMTLSVTYPTFLKEEEIEYLKANEGARIAMGLTKTQNLHAFDAIQKKMNDSATAVKNPALAEARVGFAEAQAKLQASITGTDEAMNKIREIYQEVNGFDKDVLESYSPFF